MRQSIEGGL